MGVGFGDRWVVGVGVAGVVGVEGVAGAGVGEVEVVGVVERGWGAGCLRCWEPGVCREGMGEV